MQNILKYPYTNSQYAEFADLANKNGKVFDVKTNGDIHLVDPPVVPPTPPSDEVLALREKYRACTRSVCVLAGVEPVDKLLDVQYETVVMSAIAVDPVQATFLTQTISYCLFQLYRLDGNSAWDNI